jgi:lysophospholipase L1-like esterase
MPMKSDLPELHVFGDSISIQYGPALENCLAGQWRFTRLSGVRAASNNLDVATGANGGDSRRVLFLLREKLSTADFAPDLLLVNCGLHDIKADPVSGKTSISPEEYRTNLNGLASLLVNYSRSSAWVQTTHCADAIHNTREGMTFHRYAKDAEAYDKIARSVMADANIPVIPLGNYTRSLGPDNCLFCDHVHFNDWVRDKQAAFLADWITSWRAVSPGCIHEGSENIMSGKILA